MTAPAGPRTRAEEVRAPTSCRCRPHASIGMSAASPRLAPCPDRPARGDCEPESGPGFASDRPARGDCEPGPCTGFAPDRRTRGDCEPGTGPG
eukprot:9469334-Pyramimonas_sp.AAC.1